ncbi:MAG TPA: hypothetical protein VID73_12305 [Ktedonobacterales bacterium]
MEPPLTARATPEPPPTEPALAAAPAPPPILRATLQLYRLFDLADAIDFTSARACLASDTVSQRPVVSRGGNIEMRQLPLAIGLPGLAAPLAEAAGAARLEARLYELGIVALCLHVPLAGPLTWSAAADLLAGVQAAPRWLTDAFRERLDTLRATIAPALQRPNATVREEDYTHLVVERLGAGVPASALARHPALLQAALGERKALSAAAAALATPLSYYDDDLILLTWNTALIIDPDPAARDDAALLLEFANVQLLAFRTYDARVDAELAALTPRVARMRRFMWPVLLSSRRFLSEVHSLIADITDTSARVENALKVTEDVYWNRVYTAALAVLRVEVFRTGVADGLRVLREMAGLLHDEAEATWTSFLEVLVIVLILIEIILAVLGLRH